jgi:hypothetical protein
MFSTQQQPIYSYYNFSAGNHQQYNEGEEARWGLEDPRFVSSAEEQLWRVDEPIRYQGVQYDGKYGGPENNGRIQAASISSFPASSRRSIVLSMRDS